MHPSEALHGPRSSSCRMSHTGLSHLPRCALPFFFQLGDAHVRATAGREGRQRETSSASLICRRPNGRLDR